MSNINFEEAVTFDDIKYSASSYFKKTMDRTAYTTEQSDNGVKMFYLMYIRRGDLSHIEEYQTEMLLELVNIRATEVRIANLKQ